MDMIPSIDLGLFIKGSARDRRNVVDGVSQVMEETGFFFVTGQLYVDKVAPDEVRSSAQGFIAFVTLGAGMFAGGILNGWWNSQQMRGISINI